MAQWHLVITGCGTSHGCPPWGWPHLWSTERRDHRRRSGALALGPAGQVLLLDVGPDLLHQLRDPWRDWDGVSYPHRCVTRCDAVLITHDHADHVHGINELRHLNRLQGGGSIPLYGHPGHLQSLREMFGYCFTGPAAYEQALPSLELRPVVDGEALELAGLRATPFALDHGPAGRSTGWRLGDLAYCTDVKAIPEASWPFLTGLSVLILGVLREEEHETHLCWREAAAVIARVGPRRTVLVHMGPELRYHDLAPRLPPTVEPAYDGLQVEFAS